MKPLRLCLLDMNAGAPNRAIAALRAMTDTFFARVAAANDGLACERIDVDVRSGAAIPLDCDLYVGSGGPGSPLEIDTAPWGTGLARLIDDVALAGGAREPKSLLGICYSFEVIAHRLSVGRLERRPRRLLGVWTSALTFEGRSHPLLAPLGDPYAGVEVREWDVCGKVPDSASVLALQRVADRSSVDALAAFCVGDTIEAVQFHPEAEPAEVVRWLAHSDVRTEIAGAYGADVHERMCTLAVGDLMRTFAHVVPGWLDRRFETLARARGYRSAAP